MPRPPRVVHLDEIETIPGPGTLTWHPVRAHLGLRAFGTNAYTAQRVGDEEGARAALAKAIARQPEVEEYVRQDAALAKLL